MKLSRFLLITATVAVSLVAQTSTGHMPPAATVTSDLYCTNCSGSATTWTGGIITSTGTLSVVGGSWRRTETRPATGKPITMAQVKLSARHLSAEQVPAESYLAAARLIHLESATTDEVRMLRVIDRLGLPVYEFAKVDGYLYREALKQGTNVRWAWKPLRESDRKAIDGDSLALASEDLVGSVALRVYGHAVPEQVLIQAREIMKAMPDVVFLVSDYEVVKPDPFLAITTKKLLAESKIWIVAQWDEPGFGVSLAHTVPSEPSVAVASAGR